MSPRSSRVGGAGESAVGFVDERLGAARGARFLMSYVFPDHWSFLLGEIALYSFIVLIATGTYLALFFDPSTTESVYHGGYAALQGQEVSAAYASALHLSFAVSGGLLMRQTHHWAALVFVAAITLHLLRIIFTGAFRKPREINYLIGLTLLVLAILEGFAGYSLPDDLLSGMGLAIAWAVAMSLPLVGGPFAFALWGGRFPGSTAFESRLYIAHVFVIPALIATLLAAHLAIIMIQRHSQFRGPGAREDNVVGTPMWPGYALRSLGLFVAVAAVLVLMGGLIQINPIWLWGPYHPYIGTNGAQPDWYLGWLIGALRLMPNLEIHVFGHTLVPNPFFGGVLFPGIVFTLLYRCRGSTSASSPVTTAATTCSSARARIPAAARSPPPCSQPSRRSSRPARPTACSSSSASATKARSGSSGAPSWWSRWSCSCSRNASASSSPAPTLIRCGNGAGRS